MRPDRLVEPFGSRTYGGAIVIVSETERRGVRRLLAWYPEIQIDEEMAIARARLLPTPCPSCGSRGWIEKGILHGYRPRQARLRIGQRVTDGETIYEIVYVDFGYAGMEEIYHISPKHPWWGHCAFLPRDIEVLS